MIDCDITKNEIIVPEAETKVALSENGATLTFVGRVRNNHEGKKVKSINYDGAIKLAKNILIEIAKEAQKKSTHKLAIYVRHFVGHLEIGGISVIIAIGSPHRDSAYQASRYIIEEIKKRLPIWKQEFFEDGTIEWQKGFPLQNPNRNDLV